MFIFSLYITLLLDLLFGGRAKYVLHPFGQEEHKTKKNGDEKRSPDVLFYHSQYDWSMSFSHYDWSISSHV